MPSKKREKRCKECGRIIPFEVQGGQNMIGGSKNYCGYCVNPESKEWIERYEEWIKKRKEAKKNA